MFAVCPFLATIHWRRSWSLQPSIARSGPSPSSPMWNVAVAHQAGKGEPAAAAPPRANACWERPEDPTIAWKADAENELLVALRDGDLHRAGPLHGHSDRNWGSGLRTRNPCCTPASRTDQPGTLAAGRFEGDRLTARDWEFIDIRMPRFLVKAIWPDYVPAGARCWRRDEIYHALSRADAGGDRAFQPVRDFAGGRRTALSTGSSRSKSRVNRCRSSSLTRWPR